jgi:hypothetical protein
MPLKYAMTKAAKRLPQKNVFEQDSIIIARLESKAK